MSKKNPFAFKLRTQRNPQRPGEKHVTAHSISRLVGSDATRDDLLQLLENIANGLYTPRDLYLDVEEHVWYPIFND